MHFNDLTPEQKEKLSTVTSPEELLALARDEGRELSDDELEQIAGGGGGWVDENKACPDCGAKPTYINGIGIRYCAACGKEGGF